MFKDKKALVSNPPDSSAEREKQLLSLKQCSAEKAKLEGFIGKLIKQSEEEKKYRENLLLSLKQCSAEKAKLEDSIDDLKNILAQAVVLGEPPHTLAVYVGKSEWGDRQRKAKLKEIFGFEPNYFKCYLILGDGSEAVGSVAKPLGEKLEPGHLVMINQNLAVVEAVADEDIKNLMAAVVGTVDDIQGGVPMVTIGFGYHARGVIVSPKLREELSVKPLEVGDKVFLFGSCILKVLERKPLITTKQNIKKVKFADLGGLDDKIQEIRDALLLDFSPIAVGKMNKGQDRGAVLYGPPGCGKTTLVAALTNELGYHLEVINGSEISDKFVGETPRKMRESFNEAMKRRPSIWFIDEADALFPVRGSSLSAEHKTDYLSQFNVLTEGIENTEGIFVMLSTNRIDQIDPSLLRPGRTGRKIYIPRPSKDGAPKILQIYLSRHPVGEAGNSQEIINRWIEKIVAEVYRTSKASSHLFTAYSDRAVYSDRTDSKRDYYFKDFVSGDILKSMVGAITMRALKRLALERIEPEDPRFGIASVDIEGVVSQSIIREVPQDDKSRNQWLMVNGYEMAYDFTPGAVLRNFNKG